MTDATSAPPAQTAPAEPPLHGVGPFTVREVVIVATWLVAFVVSFFPVFVRGTSVWLQGIEWVLPIGVPTAAVFLIVLRRFSPAGIRRVGSLGVDQFASVAFSVAAVLWLGYIWASFAQLVAIGSWPVSWVIWVEFFAMLALVAATVFAPVIPVFSADFRGRAESVAHPNARAVRAVVPRPAVVAPIPPYAPTTPEQTDADPAEYAHQLYDTAARPGAAALVEGEPWAPTHTRGTYTPVDYDEVFDDTSTTRLDDVSSGARDDGADVDAWSALTVENADPTADAALTVDGAEVVTASATNGDAAHPAPTQAFWALAPEERDVLDEAGRPLFRVGPTAWALVIEDRGGAFVVRHEDGRIGYLHDVEGVTRG